MTPPPAALDEAAAEYRRVLEHFAKLGLPGSCTVHFDGRTVRRQRYTIEVTGAPMVERLAEETGIELWPDGSATIDSRALTQPNHKP